MGPSSDLSSRLLAQEARKSILNMVYQAQAAHVGSALSVVDIVAAAYTTLNLVPPSYEGSTLNRDIFILSKGHAAAALYAVLALRGYFPPEWIRRYSQDGAELGGHVTFGVPGVVLSSGSLGHGIPFGAGVALAKKKEKDLGQVAVVVSDGELNEGSNWEALMFSSHHALTNLTVLVDRNHLQSLTSTEKTLSMEPLADKVLSFGWDCVTIDGHDHEAIANELSGPVSSRPRLIICETIKGKGVTFMENEVKWHYRPPDKADLALALSEVMSNEI